MKWNELSVVGLQDKEERALPLSQTASLRSPNLLSVSLLPVFHCVRLETEVQ